MVGERSFRIDLSVISDGSIISMCTNRTVPDVGQTIFDSFELMC
jgi:hypothetical protein